MNYQVPKWSGTVMVFVYHGVAIYSLLAPRLDFYQRSFGILIALLTIGGRGFLPLAKQYLKTLINKKAS